MVSCVYRRRLEDMTALPDEVAGATAEGAEMITLAAPVRIEADDDGVARALWVQPQIIGDVDGSGRPKPNKAAGPGAHPGGYHRGGHRPGHRDSGL